jgi:hypothetical protein
VRLREIEGAFEGTLFVIDFFLELEDSVEDSFGARRAAGDVDVHRKNLIAALHDGVVVEYAAGSGAGTHRNYPLGFGHLIVELANDGSHFLREAAGDDHEIGLARRWAKNLGAETRDVEAGGGHGHHFDGAAGEPESEGPDGAAASPVHSFVERRENDAFVFEELAEVVGLSEGDVLAERCAHWASSRLFSHIEWWETNGVCCEDSLLCCRGDGNRAAAAEAAL